MVYRCESKKISISFLASSFSKEEELGKVNLLSSLQNFNGYLNGNAHTIYGLYITSSVDEELALFNNLTGSINDLYIDNSLIFGAKSSIQVWQLRLHFQHGQYMPLIQVP